MENQENQENQEMNLPVERPLAEYTKEELIAEVNQLKTRSALFKANLDSAYEKIRKLTDESEKRLINEHNTDALVLQAVSVFSNTISLAIKNKNI